MHTGACPSLRCGQTQARRGEGCAVRLFWGSWGPVGPAKVSDSIQRSEIPGVRRGSNRGSVRDPCRAPAAQWPRDPESRVGTSGAHWETHISTEQSGQRSRQGSMTEWIGRPACQGRLPGVCKERALGPAKSHGTCAGHCVCGVGRGSRGKGG